MIKKTLLTLHDKLSIIAEHMAEVIKNLKRLLRPFFRPIRPGPSPFSFAPGVADHNETFALALYRPKNRVRVTTDQSLYSDVRKSIPGITEIVEGTCEESVFVSSQ